MYEYKTFALVGAGNVGGPIIDELLTLQTAGTISSIKLLTRSNSRPIKGVEVVTVDYSDPSSLETALSGVDVVISTVGGKGLQEQFPLARAAAKAGVKLFAPSEFGSPTDKEVSGPLGAKYKLKQELKSLGVPYVAIYTGLFTKLILSNPPWGWDLPNGKVTIYGHGDAKNTWSDIPDIARYVAHVLTAAPREKLEWQSLRIQADLVSFNEILAAYEARTGKKLDVTRVSREELEERVKNNPDDFVASLLLRWDRGEANVGTSGPLSLDLFPDWNPKKVVDVIA